MVKKNKGGGKLSLRATFRHRHCAKRPAAKFLLSFLTFCPSVSLTTGNIHKKTGKKASLKAQLYLRDAPPPADFDILT